MSTFAKVACCLCGSLTVYNSSGMCAECLAQSIDITEGMDKSLTLVQCGKCGRWHTELDRWVHHEMESASLLALCLKKMRLPSECKICSACFLWTEPHSKRIKVQAELEKEVCDGKVTVGSKLVVEFKVVGKQCMECIREATDHTWGAMIQVRQRVGHKRSFFALERLLVDTKCHDLMTDVEVVREGLDLYFKTRNQAEKVMDVICGALPAVKSQSRKLVSQDKKSNTSKYELTTLLEVAPLCKGDLVLLPKSYTGSAEIMLLTKLQSSLHLINPATLASVEVKSQKYFTAPFTALLSIQHLVQFVVLDITVLGATGGSKHPTSASASASVAAAAAAGLSPSQMLTGGVLAEAEVARESDLGDNDTTFRVLTHLGHILEAGDTVLGYMLLHATLPEEGLLDGLSPAPPDVVLVRKTYPEKQRKRGGGGGKRKVRGRWLPAGSGGGGGGGGKGDRDGGAGDAEDAAFEAQLEDEAALADELGVAVEALVGAAHGGFVGKLDGDEDEDEDEEGEGEGEEGEGEEEEEEEGPEAESETAV